ncbi:MAG: ABC transporter permease [Verrucomicrobiota bacterium]
MRGFFTLLKHELRMLLISPATYVAAVVFLLMMAFFYWAVLDEMALEEQTETPAATVFRLFWWPVCFLVPLLTMRSLAEERRQGTLETMLTTPASAMSVVLSKFVAAYLFYILLWGLTAAFPFITLEVSQTPDLAPVLLAATPLIGGLSFVAVSGLLFIAIGIFSSCLTRSQLVAGMLSFTLLFLLFLLGWITANPSGFETVWLSWIEEPLGYLHTFAHLDDFVRGVIDTRPFIYYASFTALFLGLSVLIVEAKASR